MNPLLISQTAEFAVQSEFPNTPEGRKKCIDFFKTQTDEINELLDKYFLNQPSSNLNVLEVLEHSSPNRPLAFYIPPRDEPLAAGKLYVNTWKAQNLTTHLAKSFAYHE